MEVFKNITKNIKVYLLIYTLVLVGLVFYLIFSVLVNTPKLDNSEIPAYSLNHIEKVTEKLERRNQRPLFAEPTVDDGNFGKEEPFR